MYRSCYLVFMAAFLFVVIRERGAEARGIPSEARHMCKAFDHQRLLQVKGCEDAMIPDRMCRGLCHSYVFPKLKNNHRDSIEVSKEGTTSATTVVDTGDEDEEDENEVIELKNDHHNQCLMCLPKRFKQQTFTVKCRREQLRRTSDRQSPTHPAYWFFGVGGSSGDAVHELRQVKVDILQDCECQQVKCEPWTNPSVAKTDGDDDGGEDIDGQ